ncbi:hypothetical protein PR202_ga24828 [Eleusine coracana subsp. coracana]|uniref:Uncharacterized protein n=1 Tax=Eleusine coracana subsp. coracana TaxID=191504 RepID=A0AAV5D9R0_ELECO|nr:hypothetical protein PR202_ga24828 [Eleusine coracana subsp. coracana]
MNDKDCCFELIPVDGGATGPESLAFDGSGDGPYTGGSSYSGCRASARGSSTHPPPRAVSVSAIFLLLDSRLSLLARSSPASTIRVARCSSCALDINNFHDAIQIQVQSILMMYTCASELTGRISGSLRRSVSMRATKLLVLAGLVAAAVLLLALDSRGSDDVMRMLEI